MSVGFGTSVLLVFWGGGSRMGTGDPWGLGRVPKINPVGGGRTMLGEKFRLVAEEFGGGEDLLTRRDFVRGVRELGLPVPRLSEGLDGVLRVRAYTNDEHATIYDGHPDFNDVTWLFRGARWLAVLEPVKNR